MKREQSDELVRGFLATLRVVCFIRRAALLATAWLFFWGTAALVLRMVTRVSTDLLLGVGTAVLIPLLALAWLLEQRRAPSLPAVRALLDSSNDCGGLLMSADEAALGTAWIAPLTGIVTPRISWPVKRIAGMLLAALVFTGFAFMAPVPKTILHTTSPLEIRNMVEEIKASVDQLEDSAAIDTNKAVEIREELARLVAEARGEDPGKAWETIDHIEDAMSDAARKALEETVASAETVSRAEELAQTAMESSDNPELLSDSLRELADLMKDQNMTDLPGIDLPPGLLDALANNKLTPEQMRQIAELLKNCKGNLQNQMIDLSKLKCLAGDFKMGECNGNGDTNSLMLLLAQCGGAGGENNAQEQNGLPGKGGINRGRGDAPMTWSEGTTEDGFAFKEEALPQGRLTSMKDSIQVGLSAEAPEKTEGRDGVLPGALKDGDGKGSSHSQAILPRHRRAVEQFFDRTEKKGE